MQNGKASLAWRDLQTHEDIVLEDIVGVSSLGGPVFSPDGKTLAFAGRTSRGFNIFVRNHNGDITRLTDDASYNYGPRWVDDHRIVFMRGIAGRLQVVEADIATGALMQRSDVPYTVFDPAPMGNGRLAFLNAMGAGWQLATVTHTATPIMAEPQTVVASAAQCPDTTCTSDAAVDARADEATPPPLQPIQIAQQSNYSGGDGLWPPLRHIPWGEYAAPTAAQPHLWRLGLDVAGQDHLAWHNYMLNVAYNGQTRQPEFKVSYRNAQLSPWSLESAASYSTTFDSREWAARVMATRSIYSHGVGFGLQALRWETSPAAAAALRHSAVGPEVHVRYNAGVGTLYGGIRRGLSAGASAAFYPAMLSGDGSEVVDTGAKIEGIIPGLSKRQTLHLGVLGRALFGDRTTFVEVGGAQYGQSAALLGSQIPLQGSFQAGWFARRVAIAHADYRYHIVIDRGLPPTAWSPSFFVPQLDVKVFSNIAWVDNPLEPIRRTVGAAMTIRSFCADRFPCLGLQIGAAYSPDVLSPVTPFFSLFPWLGDA